MAEKTLTCRYCDKSIHYVEDWQSWRHDYDNYDRCQLIGKRFATPKETDRG